MGLDLNTGERIELSESQKIIYEIFKEIKKILDSDSMKYYMLGGTLLGAVRHKGFIPWDDDIDIGLERADYEKFLRTVGDKLPPYLELHTYKSNPEHHYYFSRIVDTRRHMRRYGSLVERDEDVWVDVFPLDGMPNGIIRRRIHMFRLLYVRARYHIACFDRVNLQRPNRPLSERIVIKVVLKTGVGRRADYRKYLDRLDTLSKKYAPEHSNWIVNIMGQYKFKEMFPKSRYGKGKLYTFEDMELFGPEDADFVLTQMYGNYMEPLKDSDKNVHAAKLADE